MLSVLRMIRLGAKVATWATPHVQEFNRQRNLNSKEAAHSLEVGNPEEAEKYYRLALEEKHGPTKTLELMLGLGEAQRRQRKFEEAEVSAQSALQAAKEAKNHTFILDAMDLLVDVHLDRGVTGEAAKLAREAMRLESMRPRPDPPRLIKHQYKLATALVRDGGQEEAFETFRKAARLAAETHGPADVRTADILSDFGTHLRQAGFHLEAQEHLRAALETHKELHGLDAKTVANDTYELAASLEESGDLNGAMAEYEKTLILRERQIGGSVEETARLKVRLGALYLQAGKSSAARELLIHAIRVLEKGSEDSYMVGLEVLASAEEYAGRYPEAERLREKTAVLLRKRQGDKDAARLAEELAKAASMTLPQTPPKPSAKVAIDPDLPAQLGNLVARLEHAVESQASVSQASVSQELVSPTPVARPPVTPPPISQAPVSQTGHSHANPSTVSLARTITPQPAESREDAHNQNAHLPAPQNDFASFYQDAPPDTRRGRAAQSSAEPRHRPVDPPASTPAQARSILASLARESVRNGGRTVPVKSQMEEPPAPMAGKLQPIMIPAQQSFMIHGGSASLLARGSCLFPKHAAAPFFSVAFGALAGLPFQATFQATKDCCQPAAAAPGRAVKPLALRNRDTRIRYPRPTKLVLSRDDL